MSRLGSPVLAEGYLPQGAGAGVKAQTVVGAACISGGAGIWQVTLETPFADSELVIMVTPAPGSGLGGQGISHYLGSGASNGVFTINSFRNDTGAVADVPNYFIVWRRMPAL